jgi:carboxyl-terminal processing protease
VASPQGDATAAQRAAAAEARREAQQQQPGGQAGAQATAARETQLLKGSDLADVFQLILTQYVDRVDYAGLIDAAREGFRSSLSESQAPASDLLAFAILPSASGSPDRDWTAFSQTYDAVLQRNLLWARDTRPDYEATRRMLASLNDTHSSFLTADEARRRAETSYTGIGVRLARFQQESPPVIVEAFPNGPATQAGLRSGDRILRVGDTDVRTMPLPRVVDLIRGPQNTEVSLEAQRSAAVNPFAVRVFRRPLTIDPANGSMLEPRIGYIKIWSFTELVPERVGRLLFEQANGGAQGWIIDLRHNPGGDLQAVQRVAGIFLDQKPIGIAVDRQGQRQALFGERRGGYAARTVPKLVFLIDQESGSGSEILAAAFREYGLATLVGQRTAGSVGIARSLQLPDGSAASVTVQRLVSPSGATLDRVGVEPDIAVDIGVQDLEQGRDPQRDRAVQVLKQLLDAG